MKTLRILTTLVCLIGLLSPVWWVKDGFSQSSPARQETSQSVKNTKNKLSSNTILFFGNSLTAGFGLEKQQAFPNLIQQKIDSLGWNFRVVNAGLSGETSSGGLRRIDWLLRQQVDVFILELGGNDALRGVDLSVTRSNLQSIIDKVREKYPRAEIILAGMQAPPNLGPRYVGTFREMFPALAKANDVHLIPFLLEDVGGIPEMNLPDRIHPNVQGHRNVAENVWDALLPVLKQIRRNVGEN